MEDDQLFTNPAETAFDPKQAFKAWEKMRWIYNLAVGLVGVASIILLAHNVTMVDLVAAVIFGLFANLFYVLGFWMEMADQQFLRGAIGIYKFRLAIFLLGTAGSMGLTFFLTYATYTFIGAPF